MKDAMNKSCVPLDQEKLKKLRQRFVSEERANQYTQNRKDPQMIAYFEKLLKNIVDLND